MQNIKTGLAKKVTAILMACAMLSSSFMTCNVYAETTDTSTTQVNTSETTTQTTGSSSTDTTSSTASKKASYVNSKNLVTYTATSITKGKYTTKIWNQHQIWPTTARAAYSGCGICCLAMALKLSGVKTSPTKVLHQTGRTLKHCIPIVAKPAMRCLKKNKVKCSCVSTQKYSRAQCMKKIKSALIKGKMVMACVKGNPFSSGIHWVLLTGYNTEGKIVVANSSHGFKNVCIRTKKQYHVVTDRQVMIRLVRSKAKWSNFIIIG